MHFLRRMVNIEANRSSTEDIENLNDQEETKMSFLTCLARVFIITLLCHIVKQFNLDSLTKYIITVILLLYKCPQALIQKIMKKSLTYSWLFLRFVFVNLFDMYF